MDDLDNLMDDKEIDAFVDQIEFNLDEMSEEQMAALIKEQEAQDQAFKNNPDLIYLADGSQVTIKTPASPALVQSTLKESGPLQKY